MSKNKMGNNLDKVLKFLILIIIYSCGFLSGFLINLN